MGRKRKIKSGAGDLVPAPGALDTQIERANTAKSKDGARVKLRAQRRSGEKEDVHMYSPQHLYPAGFSVRRRRSLGEDPGRSKETT